MAAKPKKARKETRVQDEITIQAQVDHLSKKDNRTETETKNLKVAREKLGALKFERLAPKRVNNALKAIYKVGQLARGGYRHTDEHAQKIVGALKDAVTEAAQKFSTTSDAKQESGFSL